MAIWQSFSRRRGADERKRRNVHSRNSLRQLAKRNLRLEPFEERILLAIDGPQLLAAIPATGIVINENTVLDQAPREILLRFNRPIDPASLGASIQFVRSGDDTFGNGNDITITPNYIGVEDAPYEVIVRFSENLPDDKYRMTIVGAGASPLKDTSGNAFNGGANLVRNFSMDLPPQVVAIVPQPISRDAGGKLTQATNTIDVYFNVNDPLDAASAQNVANYQLIRTASTDTPGDDVRINPLSVSYSSATGKAVLTFNTADMMTNGTYRLRIGTSEPLATSFTTLTPATAGTSFGSAADLGTGGNPFTSNLGTQTVSLTDTINSVPTPILWPGSPLEPGERDTAIESHVMGGSNNGNIPVISYNFQAIYGQLFGQDQINLITEAQKQRVREVFAYYSYYLGVEFVETASSGWTIALGDPRVLGVTPNVGGVAGGNLAIMNSVVNWGASEPRGGFFNTSMHEIGHLLGLGHNYEAPAVQGGGVQDGVFPGDFDILYGRYLWPTLGNDINVYRFNLATGGVLNVETIAERLKSLGLGADPSQLDSVITLYDVAGNIVARNDDYYGKDSFLQLELAAGTYYVAITSTGNTNFDPRVTNSGAGGTTAGGYQLRMTFTPTPGANDSIRDTTGNRLDGDNDGLDGGVNNFWFKVANTIYVDKAATNGTGALGSITNPYTKINDALAAAPQGSIVRIVGNGGADNNLATTGDNLSYNIGFDSINGALSDGTRLDIPRGVTVMIDAGAILKLRGANINAGSVDPSSINRSEGALQILGTTATQLQGGVLVDVGSVYVTSYYNTSIGAPVPNSQGLAKGNWGGIVFRNDSDLEANGIFLNYVNQARISYGGGTVSVDGQPGIYRPIHIESARPTVTFNTITNSADAAMSATPNSFEESEFVGPGYHADYTRVGPKVYGNTLSQNSLNGLFVSIQTSSQTGRVLDELTVNGRFANTDIVHIITETLLINGNPGGLDATGVGGLQARPNGRLAIDPGTIVKLAGGRFETEFGATLLAEGTLDRPIILTSLYDDRYGGSGTSDTSNNGIAVGPGAGDWGGFLFGPTSFGSIDYSLVAFAGGSVRFEGAASTMDPVEIHQAQVRIANSTFELNQASGGGDRNGRGSSDGAVVYIRGAQPVILNNVFQNNGGAVASANVNSLNATLVDDSGRSRGTIGLAGSYPKNTGPLIRGNLIGNNSLNGMVVRGGLLTTNGIWDDTDIVHVVTGTISLGNQQSLSGTLRLQSSPTESLVVKLLGTNTDVIAGGELLDVEDRVGGTLQIVGTPGHPVVLTSLKDDTVGAGLTPQGEPQKDTRNTKGVVAPAPQNLATSGPVILDTTARDVHGTDRAGLDGWDTLYKEVLYVYNNSRVLNNGVKPNQILVIGWEIDDVLGVPYSAEAIAWVLQQPGLQGVQAVFADTGSEIASGLANAEDYAAIYVPSHAVYPLPDFRAQRYQNTLWWGGVEDFMLDTLNQNKGRLFDYINNHGGGLLVMAQDPAVTPAPYAFVGAADPFILRKSGGNVMTATEDIAAGFDAIGLTDVYLNSGTPYRSVFEGSTGFNRLTPWAVDPVTGEVAMLGHAAGGPGLGAPRDVSAPGDWGSIRLDTLSNDRNVEVINEVEQGFTSAGDANQLPTTSQVIGELAKDVMSGDDNVRLGFEIYGGLSQAADRPGGADVDVYSFRGTAGTVVWLDIDRTATSLDSVVELVDANGAVIARSDDSLNDATLVGSARRMRSGTDVPSGFSQPDFYSTNPKDAGMRVVLPGTAGVVGTYFVRVRSSSSNLTNLTGGVTKGSYVLQVRLQEKDEFAGSTVRYADVRYANDGIEVIGKPEQSIVRSSTVQTSQWNGAFDAQGFPVRDLAQDLGNLLASANNTIDVAGNMLDSEDVHWYKFSLGYEQIQSIAGLSDGLKTFAAMLQINYADGLGRPDLTMSLFDEYGQLIMISRDGQIADSLPRPNIGGIGADTANLKHGSFGSLDPTMGSLQLLAGSPGKKVTYYVAISSNGLLPSALAASYLSVGANGVPALLPVAQGENLDVTVPANSLVRLEPIDSIARVIDDRVGSTGSGITTAGSSGALFPNPFGTSLDSYADNYHFGDVVLFVNTSSDTLKTVNPFTGAEMTSGGLSVPEGDGYYNISMRPDGTLVGLSHGSNSNNSGNYVEFNTATGDVVTSSDDGMLTFSNSGGNATLIDPYTFAQSQNGMQYTAMTYVNGRLFAIAERSPGDSGLVPLVGKSGSVIRQNLLYELNPTTGEVLHRITGGAEAFNPLGVGSGTDAIPVGMFTTVAERIVGLASIDSRMFAITDGGKLYEIGDFLIPANANTDAINQDVLKATLLSGPVQVPVPGGTTITGLVAGPTTVENGLYKQTLFAIDDDGVMYSFDTSGNKRGVFLNGAWSVDTGIDNAEGLAFATAQSNLWHATTVRSGNAGHGIESSFNNNVARNDKNGGQSFYFGNTSSIGGNDTSQGYDVAGGAYGSLTSTTFDLAGYSALDKPTLYFNYFLSTTGTNSTNSAPRITDSLRVYASTDGVHWEMLATNNVTLGTDDFETPEVLTASGGSYKGQPSTQKRQGLVDNAGWSQARVDLGDYAGLANIRLRFAFSTAGTMGSGQTLPGGGSISGTGSVLKALAGSKLADGNTFQVAGVDFIFRKGQPALLPNEILIDDTMTSQDVAKAIAAALDRVATAAAGNVDDLSIFTVGKVVNDEVRIFGYAINSGGPMAFTNDQLAGDEFGNFNSRSRDRSGSTLEGVYLDDFIVGFASRGEMVTGANPLLSSLAPDAVIDDPFATAFTPLPEIPDAPKEILTGAYQLQIRPGQSYATISDKDPDLSLTQTFDVNDRLAQAITLVATVGSSITDGQAFAIDDGAQVLTFEFNSTGGQTIANSILIHVSSSDSAASIAVRIRDAINNAVLSLGFKVRAATYPNGTRVDLFDAFSVTTAAGSGTGLQSILARNWVGDTRPLAGNSAPGQTIVQNTSVSYSRQVGIQVIPKIGQIAETGVAFTQLSQFPVGTPGNSGAAATLPVQNNHNWVPGVTIKNNLVTHSGRTGIMVGGDPNLGKTYAQGGADIGTFNVDTALFVPFVRIVNNTVYDAKLGIASANNSSPTIINNIVANARIATGNVIRFAGGAVYGDAASAGAGTVVLANIYQNNTNNLVGLGDSLSIALNSGDPLFINAAANNFYLDENSKAIDSSIDSLLDRADYVAVSQPLGIAPSPILAPDLDLFGQKRVDDPTVSPPAGVGGNAFKDRGALERADFIGPTAVLLNPIDNDSSDRNTLPNQVRLLNTVLTEFAIQLVDGGVGIDDSAVDVSQFVITRTIDGVTTTLQPGFDYVLAYDTNNSVARLFPAQGLWINGIYQITLNRTDNPIMDLAGNVLQENAPPQTRFVVELTDTVVSPWQNPRNRFDVNDNGSVTPNDLIILINRILTGQTGPLPIVATVPPYLDVTGDGALRTSDVLAVVNEILRQRSASTATAPLTAVADEPQAEPLVEKSAVASGLAMNSSGDSPASDPVVSVVVTAAETTPAAVPQTVAAAFLDDAPVEDEHDGFDAWDAELDSILTDLGGGLRTRVIV